MDPDELPPQSERAPNGSSPRHHPDIDYDDMAVITEALFEQLSPSMARVVDTALEEFASWMRDRGRAPQRGRGLSETTVQNSLSRLDQILRFCLDSGIISPDGVTLFAAHETKDEVARALAHDRMTKGNGDPYDEGSCRKYVDVLKKLNEYRVHEHDATTWECSVPFSATGHDAPDYFTEAEYQTLRKHARMFSRCPAPETLSDDQRQHHRQRIAQSLGVPLDSLDTATVQRLHEDHERRSLLLTTLDTGLRPVEVRRATIDWPRLEKGVLHVPSDEAAKSEESWEPVLREDTVDALRGWLEQRPAVDRYAGTDALWLNNRGNPYRSRPLKMLLFRLLDAADISYEYRDLSWYSLRHTVAEHVREHGDIRHAKEQLRHRSDAALLQYGGPSVESRRETLQDITDG